MSTSDRAAVTGGEAATPGKPVRRRRSPAEIRRRLLCASRKEFERCGYSGARTAAIAKKADVTEAQLFRYYDSKADLFRDAVFEPLEQHFSDFAARYSAELESAVDYRDLERLYLAEFQKFLGQHSRLLLSLVVSESFAQGGAQGISGLDSLRSYFEHGAAMMAARVGDEVQVDPAVMVRVSFAAVLGCVLFKDWLFADLSVDEDEVSNGIIEFVLDGINANLRPAAEAGPKAKHKRRKKQ